MECLIGDSVKKTIMDGKVNQRSIGEPWTIQQSVNNSIIFIPVFARAQSNALIQRPDPLNSMAWYVVAWGKLHKLHNSHL
jgi:hypothetical protein